ncbi:short-chain dehydrogenase [Colletotrichum scovillei]|uniref:short-chain dehydrogenase n=1 Tax=Colletotrichum scovillei TaxID=1209932 RepID=UPI0015C34336|nr:short-chain dehydrogenase [Colletotrichum scovillei]KAF4782035.1 short-chain dehydrogenase [Colletotrichum scovillei]
MNLSSVAPVRAAAIKIDKDRRVFKAEMLVNNAGVMALPDLQLFKASIEMIFATNQVGHFLLKNRILPKIIKAISTSAPTDTKSRRFISQTSAQQDSRGTSRRRTSDLQKASFSKGQDWSDKSYVGFLSYGQSKTANILYSLSLTQTLEAKYGIGSYAIHPGAVTKNINRHAKSEEIKKALKRVKKLGFETPAKTLDQGVDPSVLSAVGPELPSPGLSSLESKGLYIAGCKLDDEHCTGFDRNLEYADKLWALSEELVKEKFDI